MADKKKPTRGEVENFCIHFPHINAENTAAHYGMKVPELAAMLGDKFRTFFPEAESKPVETAAAAEPGKKKRVTKKKK